MEDLILEAIKRFPSLPNWAKGVYKDGRYSDAFSHDKRCEPHPDWELICTREQHIKRRLEMFECAKSLATHVDIENTNEFYRFDGSSYYAVGRKGCVRCAKFDKLIPRPTKVELEYIESLEVTPYTPQVGEECEYSKNGEEWHICKPLYIGNKCIFVKSHKANKEGYKEYSLPLDNTEFRPINSERDKFIQDFINDDFICQDELAVAAIAECIYDMGYRKNE